MSPSSKFSELFDRHAIATHDKQLRLLELIGESDWKADLEVGLLSFENGVQFNIEVLGSEAEEDHSFVWSWANSASDFSERLVQSARQLKAVGERLALPELHDGMFDLGELNGTSIAMLAVGLLKADGYYRAPVPGGAVFLLIADAPAARELNDHSPVHVMGRITEALARVDLTNLPAVGAYLSYKGYALNFRGKTLHAVSPDGETLLLQFDAMDRLVTMSTQCESRQPSWRERWWPWARKQQATT